MLCGGKNEITIKELQKYIEKHPKEIENLKNEIEKNIKTRITNNKFIDEEKRKEYDKEIVFLILYILLASFNLMGIIISFIEFNTLTGIAAIVAFILEIANIVAKSICINKINVFTQKAVDEQAQLKGLKKYMEDFSMLDKKELPEIVLWEKFLVYATVFGIEKKVLSQLKIVYPDFENNVNINSYNSMRLMMNTNFSNSFTSAISSSISNTYSSATGSGGGFSGGGGRRPEDGGGGGGR